ncbi:DUF1801 domain-containing protein [Lacihabitans sp. LS3-19]|uniref:DUF1801 domain-containing protein n=1 Tax=Lacihabitans sp. LS3-19 TaxID=2487335 RepID=UPI0020CE4FEF|nr:DUF1801 domain-containing protein [Lacihabitans sp. LS3-19]MCP9770359.1 DUF1801 domain-containing protein [Lacihabitans sp. LS3-19]
MQISEYIANQIPERQKVLNDIHATILEFDKTVDANIELMMGLEMIVYKGKGMMKYGLASNKNYMSLHLMPIYGSPELHKRYQAVLPNANFQKGCINFKSEDQMPVTIVQELIKDCSKIDLMKMKEEYIKSRKK